jgi:4-amino-4-deoxy-L-arabinose transferase-like glycosyltransferase
MLRLQIVVGTLLVLLTAQLAHAFYGRKAGLAAGVIAAVYPTWIAYSHYLWSETLFTALVTGGFVAAVYGKRRGGPESWILAATAGALFGAAALTRELGLVISAACALWWVVSAAGKSRQRAIPHALVVVALSVVVILPWTIRNYQIFDRFVPVSTVGWMAIREGNTLGDDWLRPDIGELRVFRQRYFAIPGEMNRMEFAQKEAVDLIRSEQPVWLPKKVIRNLALLFSPDSFLLKKISRGSYSDLSLGTTRFLLIIAVTSYLVVIALGFMGQLLSKRRDAVLLTWMIFAAVIAVHVVANSGSRYRFPLMPLLMISAAALLSNNCMCFNKISSDRRLAAAIGLGIFIWLSCAYFFPDAISLWERGTYVVPDRP